MKKLNYTLVFICAVCFLSALNVKSQTKGIGFIGNKTSTENWRPIKVSETNGNVVNGVSFLFREFVCNSQNIVAIKLINTNPYSVNVNYVENNIKKTITISASSQLEGTCEVFTDINTKNPIKALTYLKPATNTERQVKENIVSTITVEKAD